MDSMQITIIIGDESALTKLLITPNESFLKPKNCCDIVEYGDITSSVILGNLSIYLYLPESSISID